MAQISLCKKKKIKKNHSVLEEQGELGLARQAGLHPQPHACFVFLLKPRALLLQWRETIRDDQKG